MKSSRSQAPHSTASPLRAPQAPLYIYVCAYVHGKDGTQISLNKSEVSRCRRLRSRCQHPVFPFPADFAWIRLKKTQSLVVLFTLNGEDRNRATGRLSLIYSEDFV